MYEVNGLHNATEFSNTYAILTSRKRYMLILGNLGLFFGKFECS